MRVFLGNNKKGKKKENYFLRKYQNKIYSSELEIFVGCLTIISGTHIMFKWLKVP